VILSSHKRYSLGGEKFIGRVNKDKSEEKIAPDPHKLENDGGNQGGPGNRENNSREDNKI